MEAWDIVLTVEFQYAVLLWEVCYLYVCNLINRRFQADCLQKFGCRTRHNLFDHLSMFVLLCTILGCHNDIRDHVGSFENSQHENHACREGGTVIKMAYSSINSDRISHHIVQKISKIHCTKFSCRTVEEGLILHERFSCGKFRNF